MTTFDMIRQIEDAIFGQLDYLAAAKTFLPYNLYKDEKSGVYTLEMAVAGYNKDDLSVEYVDGKLTVEAKPSSAYLENKLYWVHQGLTKKAFRTVFPISPVFMVDEVHLKDGILKITFTRNPEKVTKLPIK